MLILGGVVMVVVVLATNLRPYKPILVTRAQARYHRRPLTPMVSEAPPLAETAVSRTGPTFARSSPIATASVEAARYERAGDAAFDEALDLCLRADLDDAEETDDEAEAKGGTSPEARRRRRIRRSSDLSQRATRRHAEAVELWTRAREVRRVAAAAGDGSDTAGEDHAEAIAWLDEKLERTLKDIVAQAAAIVDVEVARMTADGRTDDEVRRESIEYSPAPLLAVQQESEEGAMRMMVLTASANELRRAIDLSDDALEAMLRTPPREVPELRSRSSFRQFFQGVTHERFMRVAVAAFSDMGHDEALKYVSKRHKLVADVLSDEGTGYM